MTEVTAGRTVADQIRRGAAAFTAVVTLIVIAVLVGGYILTKEGLTLPGWVPVIGSNFYTVNADFQTAQAVTPGQGQAVTIAGVKVGLISAVRLSNGVAVVSLHIDKQYSPIYRDATMLLRPKTALKDMTIELNKGTAAAGAVPSGGTIPVSQTAPDANLDELLASLDADTRSYLQVLLGSAGPALAGRGVELSAALRRFDPTTRDFELISRALVHRRVSLERVIHNLSILTAAISTKDTQLANLVRASNAVFATFANENASVSATVAKLPGALSELDHSLGKVTTTAQLANTALGGLRPAARALAPAERANQVLFKTTAPVIQKQLGPFAVAAQPTVAALGPAAESLGAASPQLASTLAVLNTFFNELAYNPSPSNPNYLFYLAWAGHNANSAVSTSDANGPLLQGELLMQSESAKVLLCGAAQTNPLSGIAVSQLNLPVCKASASGTSTLLAARPPSNTVRAASRAFNSGGGR